jgi:hypothetical protein
MIKDRETRLEYYREYQKMRRQACKKDGICIICQKEKATPGRPTCESCRKYQREYSRSLRANL